MNSAPAIRPIRREECIDITESPAALDAVELKIISQSEAQNYERLKLSKFELRVPSTWKSPVPLNVHAAEVGAKTIEWIMSLGCDKSQARRLIDFEASHYVGIPFPTIAADKALLISKYLSLWLLWDDVEVESGKNHWRISTSDILAKTPPEQASIYDLGWCALLQEAAQVMSPRWLESLVQGMIVWDEAARQEALISRRYRLQKKMPSFAESLITRMATIGMSATAYLLEYANNIELSAEFHNHPIVKRMKTLTNVIVGLGNDIFSFAKDYDGGYINVIVALASEQRISLPAAFAKIIKLHNETVSEFDELALRLFRQGARWEAGLREWTQQMRYCSFGFTIWESRAPRYNKKKILAGNRILEPSIVYI